MKVAHVQTGRPPVPNAVAEIELVGAHYVRLGADTKELSLKSILDSIPGKLHSKNLIQGLYQTLTRFPPVNRRILLTVGNPKVIDAALSQPFA